MKKAAFWAPIALPLVIGCSSADLDQSGSGQTRTEGVENANTICDFGSAKIESGLAYTVSIQNKDLKADKDTRLKSNLVNEPNQLMARLAKRGPWSST